MSHIDYPAALQWQLKAAGLPAGERELRFHPERKWRFDLAWPDQLLAVEIDGGSWVGGRHVSGLGFQRDAEKLAEAAIAGWRVIRVVPRMVDDGRALAFVERALKPATKTTLAPQMKTLCSARGCMTELPAGKSVCQYHRRAYGEKSDGH